MNWKITAACMSVALALVGCRSGGSSSPDATPATSAQPVAPTAEPTAPTTVAPTAPATAPIAQPTDAGAVDAPDDAERARVERALAHIKRGGEAWYGVYVMNKKVGHGRMAWRAAAEGEPGIAVGEFEMEMAVSGGGNANTIRVEERRVYGAEWPHPLVATTFKQNAAGFVEERRGVPAPDGMKINRTISGKAEPERMGPITHETLVDALRAAPLEIDGLTYGTPHAAATWTWEREADEPLTVLPLREETRRRAGVEQKVAVLQVKYEKSGVTATTVVSDAGDVLEMSLGAAVTMKLEEKDVAQSGIAGLDIMSSGIKSPDALGDPERIDRLVFELTTAGPLDIPTSADQTVARLAPDKLRITRVRGPGDAVSDADRGEALANDPTMDATSPSVVAQARALVTDDMTPADKVHAVADWVFRTLDKKLATHLPTASSVLEAKVGDCTEHTWLTVALLRAAGVPARPVYGVAYTGDGDKSFAYHAWVEVALDGHWIWIDPTWGEGVADATHLRLGDDLGGVAPSLGAITIDTLTR